MNVELVTSVLESGITFVIITLLMLVFVTQSFNNNTSKSSRHYIIICICVCGLNALHRVNEAIYHTMLFHNINPLSIYSLNRIALEKYSTMLYYYIVNCFIILYVLCFYKWVYYQSYMWLIPYTKVCRYLITLFM